MNIFQNLYDFFIHLTTICEELYNWLFTPIEFGRWEFTPILIGGGLILTIMVAKFFF